MAGRQLWVECTATADIQEIGDLYHHWQRLKIPLKTETGDGVILRLYETKGEETDAELTLFKEPKAVKTVNLLEEEDEGVSKELKREGEKIELTLKPFEIVTLKVDL